MGAATYTSALTSEQAAKLRSVLDRSNFAFHEKDHALFSAKKGKLVVTVYNKGPKVLIQGKETTDFVKFVLEPEVLGEARLGYEEINQPEMFKPHFGIDESGKGDFFGPLVVAGVFTNSQTTRALMDAGIMDSKRISSATRIRALAAIIRQTVGNGYEIVAIGPERYNQLYARFRNLNRLLAWGHARVIAKLNGGFPDCPRALSDQFANPAVLTKALAKEGIQIVLQQRTKAESDVAVAAASILARERFIDWIDKSSAKSQVVLPLGASGEVVAAARVLVEKYGFEILQKTAKTHFRTMSEIN